jgi:hypothetical protein
MGVEKHAPTVASGLEKVASIAEKGAELKNIKAE